jgi:hypothetical protein
LRASSFATSLVDGEPVEVVVVVVAVVAPLVAPEPVEGGGGNGASIE